MDIDGRAAENLRLISDAALLGVSLGEDEARRLLDHTEKVYETNKSLNLTRVPRENALTMHILDSLSGLPAVKAAPAGRWADIGSGAGFPGIPLCIAGDHHVDLIESSAKKASFLTHVAADLCLDTTIRRCRAEEAAGETPRFYTAVTMRAVSALAALVELAAPLLSIGGRAVCWKGDPTEDELNAGARAAANVGMRFVCISPVALPHFDVTRVLVVYQKVGEPRIALPRRPGMAQTRPLG